MDKPTLEELRADLEAWRGKLDRLRLQTHLGRAELRDKLRELGVRLQDAQRQARARLAELSRSGAEEAGRAVRSLQSGWEEVVRKHRDLEGEASKDEHSATGAGG